MTQSQTNSTQYPSFNISELESQLKSGSEKKQLQVIPYFAETGDCLLYTSDAADDW